jgi:hypothetical protein
MAAVVASPVQCFLVIKVIEGRGLKPSDLNGKADPYVEVWMKSCPARKHRTKVVYNTLEPQWGEECRLPVSHEAATDELQLHVWDKDLLTSDDMGTVGVPVASLPGPGTPERKWHPVMVSPGKQWGEILLEVTYTGPPLQPQPQPLGPMTDQQQALVLAWAAYFATAFAGMPAKIVDRTFTELDAFLHAHPERLGVWEVAWGPCVYQVPMSCIADNTMYVARSVSEPSTMFVCVAGTNPFSLFSWLFQDLHVHDTVEWPLLPANLQLTSPGKPHIAHGTHQALQLLLKMKDLRTGKTLQEFLTDQMAQTPAADRADIAVTGHSLGGGLCQALTLFLADTAASWDPKGQASIRSYPIAGVSIGNGAFAEYYNQRVGATTTRISNSLDPVSLAWEYSNLKKLPVLFEPAIPKTLDIQAAAEAMAHGSKDVGYTHIRADQPMFRAVEPTPGRPWTLETAYQHSAAYFIHLQITDMLPSIAPKTPVFADFLNGKVESAMLSAFHSFFKSVLQSV